MPTGTPSNKCKDSLIRGEIDFDADTFTIILMASGFSFDRDAHNFYSNLSASELADGNGYTRGAETLAGVAITRDDTTDIITVAWNDAAWTASGGVIGPSAGYVIIKDTGTASTSVIVGYVAFDSDQSAGSGTNFTITNITVTL